MAPEIRYKTPLECHDGLFRFTGIPFGLKNAPGTFNRAIDMLLSPVRCKYALVYKNDIIAFYTCPSDHLVYVRNIFSLLQAAGITLRPTKGCFMRQSRGYFGHDI